MYLESIVDGMLKGLNQQVSSLWYSILDSASRILLIIVLVPKKGMGGFLLIMVISNLLTSYLNLNRLLRVTGVQMRWGEWIVKPMVAVVISAGITFFVFRFASNIFHDSISYLLIGSTFISVLYIALSVIMGILKKEDLRNLKLRRSKESVSIPEGF
jgi:stage V sporulation protein B